MLDLEQAIQKFDTGLPRELQCEFSSDDFMSALNSAADRFGLDLVPLAIMVAVGEVPYDDLAPYLTDDLDVPAERAGDMAAELREKVFQPAIDRLRFLDTNPNKAMTLEQQKAFAERLFMTGLVAELRHDPFIIGSVNARLFFILARELAFAAVLERALYVNEENIGAAPLLLEGTSVPPSVSNWIKDYLGQYGSQAMDSVNQTNFIINSPNAKRLPAADRQLLARVIKTYINVKFFPDSMPSDDGSGWEILPGGDTPSGPAGNARVTVSAVDRPSTPSPEVKTPIRAEMPVTRRPVPVPVPAPASAPAPASRPVVSEPRTPAPAAEIAPESDELLSLKNMLLQYPAGSLERSAIEEEIRKLQKS